MTKRSTGQRYGEESKTFLRGVERGGTEMCTADARGHLTATEIAISRSVVHAELTANR